MKRLLLVAAFAGAVFFTAHSTAAHADYCSYDTWLPQLLRL